jgi:hypothetical protein
MNLALFTPVIAMIYYHLVRSGGNGVMFEGLQMKKKMHFQCSRGEFSERIESIII